MLIARLRGHELFGLLGPRELERLSAASGVMTLREGETVYRDGQPATHLFELLKGRVELRRPVRSGVPLLVDDLLPGGLFGVSSLTGLRRYILDAVCVADSEVLKIETRALEHLLAENPVAGYAIQRKVSEIFFQRYVAAMEGLRPVTPAGVGVHV